MMIDTLGGRIAELRRQMNMTQEALAEVLGVSPQAVSKWENNLSCPDIQLLPVLARTLRVTIDQLLCGEAAPEIRLAAPEARKPMEEMILRILFTTTDGDRLRVNLPLALVNAGLELGGLLQVNGSAALKQVDMDALVRLVQQGALGKLLEFDCEDEAHMEIWVE